MVRLSTEPTFFAKSKLAPQLIFCLGVFLMIATTLLQILNQEEMTKGKNITMSKDTLSNTYTHYR